MNAGRSGLPCRSMQLTPRHTRTSHGPGPRMSLWLDVAADDTIAPANSSSKVVEFFALGDANVHVHE